MVGNRRDLHVSVTGDDRGFGAAFDHAKEKAQGLDRELVKLTREQAAQEKVTASATAAVDRFAKAEDKAALAAHRMGLEARRAAEQAEQAQIRAAAAAEAVSKGLLDEAKAARIAARADDALERAAVKAAAAQIAEAEAARKAAGDVEKHRTSTVGMTSVLVSAGAAATAVAVPVAAAGLAFVGFAAVSAPAIKRVITAQQDLGANWDTLDRGQRVAALSVRSLIDDYKSLAKSYEPDALAEFNGLVSTARGLLPELDKTVASTRAGFMDLSTSVEGTIGREIPRLAGILQGQATPAMHELGTTVDETTHLAVNLVQGLAPMGLNLLTGANGVLRLANALTALDPHLVEVAATLVAVRAPAAGLGKLWTSAATGIGGLTRNAEKAESSVGKLGRTVSSSPNLYIAAALAVSYLGFRWATAKDATDRFIETQKIANNAVGNNIDGWKAYAKALGNASVGQQTYNQNLATSKKRLQEINKAGGFDPQKYMRVKKAIDAANQSIRNINDGAAALGKEFGLAAPQAIQLADAAGVDLSKAVTKSGKLTDDARARFAQYEAAVAAASNPTRRIAEDMQHASNTGLLMADRLKAVDDALAAYYGPASTAFEATTQLKAGMAELSAAMKKAHGNFSGNTDASRQLRQALKQQLDIVYTLYQANLQTKGYQAAHDAAAAQIQAMYALAGHSEQAREQVDALARSLQVTAGASGLSHDAFIATATGMGQTRQAAEKLWRAYQRLQHPVKLKVDDAEFLDRLHNAQGMKIDPKTGLFLGNNSDYFNKWLKAKGLRLDPKTGLFKGNNSDYLNKFLAANRLHIDTKTGKIVGNTSAFWDAVHKIPQTVGTRRINVVAATSSDLRQGRKTYAHGGIVHRAHGGPVQRMADGGPSGLIVGPGTSTSDSILAALSNGEYVVRASQTRKHLALLKAINEGKNGFASGGLVGFASGGTVSDNPLSLSDVLQHWQDVMQPASKADVSKAAKDRRTQLDQLRNAEDALYRARKRHDPRAVAAAERRIRKEREDLTAATKKLRDVEARYKFGKLSPVGQLDAALSLGIKDNAAFIKNLETLADRGFGDLAQKLLAMGGPQAEKIAASAVKLSTSKLKGVQSKLNQEQQQQDTLANLPAVLAARSAIKNTRGGISSWVALLDATGLDAGSLAEAVKLMAADLAKTASGKALIADMHAHGFVRGGPVSGPAGVDRVPAWLTAGEYVMTRRATAVYRPLLDALNAGRAPVPAAPARTPAAVGGATVSQTFVIHAQDPHIVARESARELAWTLR